MPLHPSRRTFLGAAAGTALALNVPRAVAASPRFAIGDKGLFRLILKRPPGK